VSYGKRSARNSRFRLYDIRVFINCPFDDAYKPIFDSIVFTVLHCGFRARCAIEIDDASQVRIERIFRIIEECRYGIHDLSRTELDRSTGLPRFNMPLELGMFLGAKRFGGGIHRRKACLIFDREAHRYQKFISDIAGQDIRAHGLDQARVISATRDWLRTCAGRAMPGGAEIRRQFRRFQGQLPLLGRELKLKPSEMTFNDFTNVATEWITKELALRRASSTR
jgi:hypothetical protein